jgi:Kef-type K+ transport system membrane component KefB
MRTLRALLVLAVALALVHHASAGAPLAARATLALGTLVVTAELFGRLIARWNWPRVSGYLAAGILLGPQSLGFVRPDEAASLGVIGDVGIALFALRAGLAVGGGGSPAAPGRIRYLTASVVVPFVFTAGAVYALHFWFPLTVHQPQGDAVAVALALAAVTVVAAPSVTWAALQDTPNGTVGGDLLWLHTIRDFVSIPLFAITIVAAGFLASAGALQPAAFWAPLGSLAVSVVAGGLLALLVSRFGTSLGVPSGAIWLIVAFGAAVAGLAGHAEATLTALIAGLALAWRDAPGADSLRRHFDARGVALAGVAFALVGVGFDLSALGALWPWMLLLVGVRAAGLYWGGRWTAREGLVTDVLASRGWLGLISQAGVGLLLAAAGRRAFPEWGVSFEALVVAVVAVNATIGPLCLRWGLAQRASSLEGVSGAA